MEINAIELLRLKDELNGLAEQSGMEFQTHDYILRELSGLLNLKVYKLENSNSLLAVFNTDRTGKTVLLRADMDAINFNDSYRHLCGHDGHTAILLYLAKVINNEIYLMNGTVILLFQAEEETGKGANEIVCSGILDKYKIDYQFALHNLPGFPKKSLVVSNGIFAKASSGIKIDLTGRASHAAEPAKGIPLEYYLIDIINLLHKSAKLTSAKANDIQLTITHINFGKPNFGTISNKAEVYAVVRSAQMSGIESYKKLLNDELLKILSDNLLEFNLEYQEEFPVTENSQQCVDILKKAVNLPTVEISEPLPWSEDFGHFSNIGDICLFGIGIGKNSAALHTDEYSFPKECLIAGIEAFYSILLQTNRI